MFTYGMGKDMRKRMVYGTSDASEGVEMPCG